MLKIFFKLFSPFRFRKTGCFPTAIATAALSVAFVIPAATQPLSEKVLQDMSRNLGKLAPLTAPTPLQQTDFNFYVLSLSWSPTYCADKGNSSGARQQCGSGRNFGFITHGLWPQYDRGYPESCAHKQASNMIPRETVSALSDIMPSAGLMLHQWKKHGTCSGLSLQAYFSTLNNAYDAVIIPASLRNVSTKRIVSPQLIEKAFIAANPGLPADGIAVICNRRNLKEIRICMDTNLKFRSCKEVDRNFCRSQSISLLPNR